VHSICDAEVRPVGIGLYLVISLLVNHSCAPNAVLLFKGTTAVLRATAPIPAGAEISMSYIEVGENKTITQVFSFFFLYENLSYI
jgi:hypothetical protein